MPARRLSTRTSLSPEALFAPLADYRTVGLAVSGGPDSLALMLLAAEYARSHAEPRFIVYSVDHGLRPEAADEVAMVADLARALGFAANGLRWEGEKHGTRVQELARSARYRLIGEAMQRDGAEVLLTAHHLHDQAETILMRMAHGSGLEGLRGMDEWSQVEGVSVYRPLLEIDPSELRGLVGAAGLVAVLDPSNEDEHYERVRWRKLMPSLAVLGLDAGRIAQLGERAGEVSRYVDQLVATLMRGVEVDEKGTAALKVAHLEDVPRVVGVRFLQKVLNRVGGNRKPHALGAVERLWAALTWKAVETTLHGCVVKSDGVTIRIDREPLKGARARRAEATKP